MVLGLWRPVQLLLRPQRLFRWILRLLLPIFLPNHRLLSVSVGAVCVAAFARMLYGNGGAAAPTIALRGLSHPANAAVVNSIRFASVASVWSFPQYRGSLCV